MLGFPMLQFLGLSVASQAGLFSLVVVLHLNLSRYTAPLQVVGANRSMYLKPQVRRQLEYQMAEKKGIAIVKPPNTVQAVKEIVRNSGLTGLYSGFYLHFLRDTAGTALYFLEYDSMRYLLGRDIHGKQGPVPSWFPVHPTLIPFLCGSLAGVSSWALIYPLDVVKTKYQERALAGIPRRSATDTFLRMARGPDPSAPRPMVVGLARIYRGLGISALRSVMTHGALWTLFDWIGGFIDALPRHERIERI